MPKQSTREKRLYQDFKALTRLQEICRTTRERGDEVPCFEFTHNGDIKAGEYPDMYAITLRVPSFMSPKLERSYYHMCRIDLLPNYPSVPPRVIWQTPIFHPNISVFDETNQLYREIRDELGSDELVIQHLNENPELARKVEGFVCLDALQENWSPSIGLENLVIELANIARYKTYNTTSPLNKVAAKWAVEQEKTNSFPLGTGGLIEPDESVIEIKL